MQRSDFKGDKILFQSKFDEDEIKRIIAENDENLPIEGLLKHQKEVEFRRFIDQLHYSEKDGSKLCIVTDGTTKDSGVVYHCLEEFVMGKYLSDEDFKIIMNDAYMYIKYNDHTDEIYALTPEGTMLYRTMLFSPKYTDAEEQRKYMSEYLLGNRHLYRGGACLYNNRHKPSGKL